MLSFYKKEQQSLSWTITIPNADPTQPPTPVDYCTVVATLYAGRSQTNPDFIPGTPVPGLQNLELVHASFNINNISETAGNVVTLNLDTTRGLTIGQIVTLAGLTTGTWLNDLPVSLTGVAVGSITFTDPTSHGAQTSQAETGTVGYGVYTGELVDDPPFDALASTNYVCVIDATITDGGDVFGHWEEPAQVLVNS